MPKFHFSSVSLGCSKNLVDLEFAIGQILKMSDRHDVQFYEDPEDPAAEWVIVNTCGFLSSAREESEQTLAKFDKMGKKLVLMGCYVSVKDDKFLAGLKNLKTVLPFVSYENIEQLVAGGEVKGAIDLSAVERAKGKLKAAQEAKLADYLSKIGGSQIKKKAFVWKGDEVRAYVNAPFGHEYLKIAEGCDNNCTFCIIPKIRGRQRSRPVEDVVAEAAQMVSQGVREIQVIAQDSVRYGTDLYGESRLVDLLEALDKLPGDFRIRAYYLYPDALTLENLKRLKGLKKFIPWFDIPFQHSSPSVLKRMGRCYDRPHMERLLDFVEKEFPGSLVRTAFIVGFPGETDEDFEDLLEFVKRRKFGSVGVFQYHDEPLAASSKLADKVPEAVAHERMARLGDALEAVYAERAAARRGKPTQGYVMSCDGETAVIRPELHAPDVDEYDEVPLSAVSAKDRKGLDIGSFVEYAA